MISVASVEETTLHVRPSLEPSSTHNTVRPCGPLLIPLERFAVRGMLGNDRTGITSVLYFSFVDFMGAIKE